MANLTKKEIIVAIEGFGHGIGWAKYPASFDFEDIAYYKEDNVMDDECHERIRQKAKRQLERVTACDSTSFSRFTIEIKTGNDDEE